jgi:hypothetical protein
MQRNLEPELLDSLPHNHPDALHNRRDLRLINRVLGNHRWFGGVLPPLLRPHERALELGAGTGELGLLLARRGVAVDGLDLWPRPAAWPRAQEWHSADLRTFADYGRYAVIFGNLIFHQFSAAELRELGGKLPHSTRAIVACEPSRRRLSQILFRLIAPLFGANYVSLHDAHVSVAAGFRAGELPLALGLKSDAWDVRRSSTLLGAYRMVAIRRA